MARGCRWALLVLVLLGSLGMSPAGSACELPPLQDPAKPQIVYRLDPAKSVVRFDAKAFMHDFSGKTSKLQATIRLSDMGQLSDAEACLQIDAASLETGNSIRDDTMRRESLETARYPTIDFRLEQAEDVQPKGEGWDFIARGRLSIHGVTREIRLPIQARRDGDTVRLTAGLPLRMSEYHIRTPKFLFVSVDDQIRVSFDLLVRRAQ